MMIRQLIGAGALVLIFASPAAAGEKTAAPETQTAATAATTTIADGVFSGRSKHITTGAVTLRKQGERYFIDLGADFSLDGAPAPVLGFGKSGKYDRKSQFSKLKKNTGAQSYALPEEFDPSAFDEIYVWCKRFSIPLGVAPLKADQS